LNPRPSEPHSWTSDNRARPSVGFPSENASNCRVRTFVVAQLALTQPLLVGVAMMIAISVSDLAPHPGFAVADRVVMAELNPNAGLLSNAPDPMPRVMQRLAALPGVTGVLSDRAGYGLVTLEAQGVGP
jgi:hypothetical protein